MTPFGSGSISASDSALVGSGDSVGLHSGAEDVGASVGERSCAEGGAPPLVCPPWVIASLPILRCCPDRRLFAHFRRERRASTSPALWRCRLAQTAPQSRRDRRASRCPTGIVSGSRASAFKNDAVQFGRNSLLIVDGGRNRGIADFSSVAKSLSPMNSRSDVSSSYKIVPTAKYRCADRAVCLRPARGSCSRTCPLARRPAFSTSAMLLWRYQSR